MEWVLLALFYMPAVYLGVNRENLNKRLGRVDYIVQVVLSVVFTVAGCLGILLLSEFFSINIHGYGAIVALFAAFTCGSVFLIYRPSRFACYRINDAGWSEPAKVMLFVPGLNLLVIIVLFFIPTKDTSLDNESIAQ